MILRSQGHRLQKNNFELHEIERIALIAQNRTSD